MAQSKLRTILLRRSSQCVPCPSGAWHAAMSESSAIVSQSDAALFYIIAESRQFTSTLQAADFLADEEGLATASAMLASNLTRNGVWQQSPSQVCFRRQEAKFHTCIVRDVLVRCREACSFCFAVSSILLIPRKDLLCWRREWKAVKLQCARFRLFA